MLQQETYIPKQNLHVPKTSGSEKTYASTHPSAAQHIPLRQKQFCPYLKNDDCWYGQKGIDWKGSCKWAHPDPIQDQGLPPPTSKICRYFEEGTCWYGPKGSAHEDSCPYPHPEMCRKFMSRGATRKGCTKGRFCKYYHPSYFCGNSVKFLECYIKDCKATHHHFYCKRPESITNVENTSPQPPSNLYPSLHSLSSSPGSPSATTTSLSKSPSYSPTSPSSPSRNGPPYPKIYPSLPSPTLSSPTHSPPSSPPQRPSEETIPPPSQTPPTARENNQSGKQIHPTTLTPTNFSLHKPNYFPPPPPGFQTLPKSFPAIPPPHPSHQLTIHPPQLQENLLHQIMSMMADVTRRITALEKP